MSLEIEQHLPFLLDEPWKWEEMRFFVKSKALAAMPRHKMMDHPVENLEADMLHRELFYLFSAVRDEIGHLVSLRNVMDKKKEVENADRNLMLTPSVEQLRNGMFDVTTRQYMRHGLYKERRRILLRDAATAVQPPCLDLQNSHHQDLLNHSYLLQSLRGKYADSVDYVLERL